MAHNSPRIIRSAGWHPYIESTGVMNVEWQGFGKLLIFFGLALAVVGCALGTLVGAWF